MRKMFSTLAALALIASPAFAADGPAYNSKIKIGQKAPSFSGIPATENGKDTSISLGDVKEDVVVLVFLANHCPVVVNCEDRIIDIVDAYKGKSVKFIGVCVNNRPDDELPAIKERVAEKGYNYVYGHDNTQAIGRAYGAVVTPEFFVLDKDRVIRYAGAMDDSPNNPAKVTKTYLKEAIDALLAGESVATPTTKALGCSIKYDK